jgi:lipopolysaccharide export system protein LptA
MLFFSLMRKDRSVARALHALPWMLCALIPIGAAAAPVSAPPGSLAVIAGEVLDLKADKLDVDIQSGSAVLEGKVSATLGDLRVNCAKIEVKYDQAPNVRWAKGSGGVTASMRGIEATAAQVEVDVQRRSVELSGNVRLSRGRGWVTAERARIDLGTRHVTLDTVQGSIPVTPPAR